MLVARTALAVALGGSMKVRGVLLIGAVIGAGGLGATAACSAPDPSAITYSVRPGPSGEPQGPSSTSSSGGTTPTDAGAPAAPDKVFKTDAFTYTDPGVTANTANAAHGGNVEGKNCIAAGCHAPGGARPWVFAGTLYTTSAGAKVTVRKGQIRVVDPSGATLCETYTDANGNFWCDKAGTTIPTGSIVGVRKEGGASHVMNGALQATDNGGCSAVGTCHGGQQGKVLAD